MKRPSADTPKRQDGESSGIWAFGRLVVWAFAHALLMAAIFPPLSLWPLTFLAPAPLALLALRARSTFVALAAVLIAQMLLWLWLLRWIMPVTVVGYPFLALYMSLHTMLLLWVLRRVTLHPRLARWPQAILLPVIWTACEFFRGEIAFNGYPWYLLAHPLINWLSFAQSSDLFGAYFVTFLAAIPAAVAIDLFAPKPRLTTKEEDADHVPLRERAQSGSSFIRPGVTAIVLLAANVAYGQWRLHQTSTLAAGPRILAIQTNLPQDNKIGWTLEQQAKDVPGFMQLTREALTAVGGRENVDLVVWPETMAPSLGFDPQTREHIAAFGESREYAARWTYAIEDLSRELGVPMLIGSEAWIGTRIEIEQRNGVDYAFLERDKEYNSTFLIQGDPPYQRYDKAVLTPFGETMPYISNWKWLEQQLLALGAQGMAFNLDSNPDIAVLKLNTDSANPGSRSDPASVVTTFALGTPICFEDTVSSLCRRMAYAGGGVGKRLDVIVNISNDGWFGSSDADRRLHAQIASFRCIENRLPMVRCVNTGLSVHIDSCGRMVAGAGPGTYGVTRQPGWLLADVQVDGRQTLFGRIGNIFPAACGVLTIGLLVWTFWRRKALEGAVT